MNASIIDVTPIEHSSSRLHLQGTRSASQGYAEAHSPHDQANAESTRTSIPSSSALGGFLQVAIGVGLVAIGIPMLVLPGPGLLSIGAGSLLIARGSRIMTS